MNKFLNILIITRSLPFHQIGGMEIIVWDLAKQFARDGHNVKILTTNIENKPEKFTSENITIINLKNTKPGKYSYSWWRESDKYFQNNFFKTSEKLVVLSVAYSGNGIIKYKKRMTNKASFYFQAHGTAKGEVIAKFATKNLLSLLKSVKNIWWMLRDPFILTKYDGIIAVGDRVENDLKTYPTKLYISPKQIHFIRNGIDTQLFTINQKERTTLRRELKVLEDEILVISASRLHNQKGVDLAIKGFYEALKKNGKMKYIIIGDGPERYKLHEMVKELDIQDKIIFMGELSREKLASYLNAGDFFLFTSTHIEAGLPLNVLEALASGLKVVVSSQLSGIEKINRNVIISINPKSPKEIASALTSEINKNKKSNLPEEFSLTFCVNSYIKLFNYSQRLLNE